MTTADALLLLGVPAITGILSIVALKWYGLKRSTLAFVLAFMASLAVLLGILLLLLIQNPLMSECSHVTAARKILWLAIVSPILIVICACFFVPVKRKMFWIAITMWLLIPPLAWQYSIRNMHAPTHMDAADLTGRQQKRLQELSLPRLLECAVAGELCAFSECTCSAKNGCYSD